MIVLNLLSVTLGDILLLGSTDNMSAEVELLAVMWEVRESVLYTTSSSHYYSHPLKLIQGEMDQSMRRHLDQQGWDYPVVWW